MKTINLIGAHYLPLAAQGSPYLSAKLQKCDGTIKILVASLKRKVYLIEYQFALANNYVEPKTKELHFAFISGKQPRDNCGSADHFLYIMPPIHKNPSIFFQPLRRSYRWTYLTGLTAETILSSPYSQK